MQRITFTECVERLNVGLAGPLPGLDSQLTMAPEYRPTVSMPEAARTCREAAVLILLYPVEDEPTLVLTIRPESLRHHAGQIALPGGRREKHESLAETAIREAHEEVGLLPHTVEMIGKLTPLFVPPSNFCVYPYVGICHAPPQLVAMEHEVDTILYVSVNRLLNPDNRRFEWRTFQGKSYSVPFYAIDSYRIWGATAMILAEYLDLIEKSGYDRLG